MLEFSAFSDEIHHPFVLPGDAERVAILIHGFPGTPYEMRSVGEVLQELGYTVHGLLLPGFGSEIQELSTKNRDDWIMAIKTKFEEVEATVTEVILIGYSFGGALSINLLHEFPQLTPDKLILIAPFWNLFAAYNVFIRIFGPVVWPIGRIFSPDIHVYEAVDFDDPTQRRDLEIAFSGTDLDDPEVRKFLKTITIPFSIIDELYKIGRTARRVIRDIDTKILVLQGSHDKIVTPTATKSLISRVKTDLTYEEIPEMTHEFIKPDRHNKPILSDHLKKFLG